MKKLNYVVYVYDTVGNEHQIPPEYAASAHDQLLAGKDVHYWYEDPDTHEMVEVIIPYEAVAVAFIAKTSEDVDAPTDAICESAEPAGRLVVTPTEPLPSLILNNEGGSCTVNTGFGITATFDGVELTEEQLWTGMTFEVVGATHNQGSWVLPVDCDALSVTYTTVYTYEGETCSVTVTQSIGLG